MTGDIVRIGDLIDNAGVVADVPIFRAPDLGTTGAVADAAVLEAVRSHDLVGLDTRGLDEVMVTRASRAIAVPDIEAHIAQRACRRNTALGDARQSLDQFRSRRARGAGRAECARRTAGRYASIYDPRTGRFDVDVRPPGSASMHRQPLRFTGTAVETFEAVVRHARRSSAARSSRLPTSPSERRPKAEIDRQRRRQPRRCDRPCGPRARCVPASRCATPI